MACRTFTVKTPKKRRVTRCSDRKLSDSAKARYEQQGVCRDERKRFARCDTESPAPRDVLEAERSRESKADAELRKLRGKVCFRTKAAMVKALTQANEHITERCETDSTGVEFEAINHKYDRTGKRIVTNCRDAIRVASPTRPPYCLDRVDLDTLSEIDAAKKRGGFRLPPQAVDALTELEARQRHEDDEEYGAPGRPEPRPYELEGLRRLIRPRRRR